MSLDRSWQFVGGLGSLPYRLFDALRRGLNKQLVRYLMQQVADAKTAPSIRVIEAGCGTGFALSLMEGYPGVTLAVALDVDESALREGKRRKPDLVAVVGNLFQLPFRDNAFDLVYNSSTVEHLADPGAAACEMQRVCHENGRVFIGVPYLHGPLAFQRAISNTRLGVWLGPVFTRKAVRELLQRCHLRPLTSITYFFRFFIGVLAEKRSLPPPLIKGDSEGSVRSEGRAPVPAMAGANT